MDERRGRNLIARRKAPFLLSSQNENAAVVWQSVPLFTAHLAGYGVDVCIMNHKSPFNMCLRIGCFQT